MITHGGAKHVVTSCQTFSSKCWAHNVNFAQQWAQTCLSPLFQPLTSWPAPLRAARAVWLATQRQGCPSTTLPGTPSRGRHSQCTQWPRMACGKSWKSLTRGGFSTSCALTWWVSLLVCTPDKHIVMSLILCMLDNIAGRFIVLMNIVLVQWY